MSLDRSWSTIFKFKSLKCLHYSFISCSFFLYKVIWIMNYSLEVDLSKELSAPAKNNIHQQIEAAPEVRDMSLLLVLYWLLYLMDFVSYDRSSAFDFHSLEYWVLFGKKVYNTVYCFTMWFTSLFQIKCCSDDWKWKQEGKMEVGTNTPWARKMG